VQMRLATKNVDAHPRLVVESLQRFSENDGSDAQELKNVNMEQYVAEVRIGSPAQTFSVLVDTGSAQLWVPGSQCASEVCQSRKTYSAVASKTMRIPEDQQTGHLEYGSGSVDLMLVLEDVTLAGVTIHDQHLGTSVFEGPAAGDDDNVFEDMLFDGILGLDFSQAFGKSRYLAPLESILQQGTLQRNIFSIYLSQDKRVPGSLVFGSVEPQYMEDEDVVWVPSYGDRLWQIQVDDFRIANRSFGFAQAVADTGSAMMSVSSRIYREARQLFSVR